MLGAIAGDIIGSVYERQPIKRADFPLFHPHCHPTDDTVLTVALADSILNDKDFVRCLKEYFARYPNAGYGGSFAQWAMSMSSRPYNSWGNGSAMRRQPGWVRPRHARGGAGTGEKECRGHAQPPGRDQGCAGDRRRRLPRPNRQEQGRDQGLRGTVLRLRPEPEPGRDPAHSSPYSWTEQIYDGSGSCRPLP